MEMILLMHFSKAAAFVGHTHYIIGVTAPALIVARLLAWGSHLGWWGDVGSAMELNSGKLQCLSSGQRASLHKFSLPDFFIFNTSTKKRPKTKRYKTHVACVNLTSRNETLVARDKVAHWPWLAIGNGDLGQALSLLIIPWRLPVPSSDSPLHRESATQMLTSNKEPAQTSFSSKMCCWCQFWRHPRSRRLRQRDIRRNVWKFLVCSAWLWDFWFLGYPYHSVSFL